MVTFALSVVDDIFDLRVPRLQIVRSPLPEKAPARVAKTFSEDEERAAEDVRRVLRREIKKWWHAVAEHLDELVGYLLLSYVCLYC